MNLLVTPFRSPKSNHSPTLPLFLGMLILLVGIWFFAKRPYQSPVVYDDQGNIELAPHRKAKLENKLKELDGAEQYALLAIKSGWYPCYSCRDTTAIFLKPGEVWKYGFTTKKEARYVRSFYEKLQVKYVVQTEGTIDLCMKAEIIKILEYPLLPEAQARPIVLDRPPGNKQDS